eukprot:3930376-Pyramimonas_sp.AAC.1
MKGKLRTRRSSWGLSRCAQGTAELMKYLELGQLWGLQSAYLWGEANETRSKLITWRPGDLVSSC